MSGAPRVEVAVGGVAVRDGEILLVRRGAAPAAGAWSVPGGRVRFGESLAEAVAREVREETGLEVEAGRFLGWVERMGDEPVPYHYVILDFLATVTGAAEPAAGDDAADARWVPVARLAEYRLVPGLLDFLVGAGVVPRAADA